MDTSEVLCDSLDVAKALHSDRIFRIEAGGLHRFLAIPNEYLWYVYAIALAGTTVHEVMTKTRRVHFDIEVTAGTIDHMVYGRHHTDHTVVAHFAELLRVLYRTRVMVSCASDKTKVSYHVWCLDTAARTLVDHREVLEMARNNSHFPRSMFDNIYKPNKSLRILGSEKPNGGGRPLVLLPDISDDVPEGETWKYIQGPYVHLLDGGRGKPHARDGVSVSCHEKYDIAHAILSERVPDLILSAKPETHGGYRATHDGRGWFCEICNRVHENDGAQVYVKDDCLMLYCFRAASEGVKATIVMKYE